MNSVSDIKPWYKNDIANTIRSLYFASKSSMQQLTRLSQEEKHQQWLGALDGWSAVLLAVGINPETIFSQDDIQFMADMKKRK